MSPSGTEEIVLATEAWRRPRAGKRLRKGENQMQRLDRRCRKITLCPAGCLKDCTPSLRRAKSWKDFK